MTTAMKPKMNISEPSNPKKCMGLMPNRERNQRESKSSYPFTKRFSPNLVFPYLRA